MFCSSCGTKLPDGAAFCTNCGKPTGLKPQPAPAPPAADPPPPAESTTTNPPAPAPRPPRGPVSLAKPRPPAGAAPAPEKTQLQPLPIAKPQAPPPEARPAPAEPAAAANPPNAPPAAPPAAPAKPEAPPADPPKAPPETTAAPKPIVRPKPRLVDPPPPRPPVPKAVIVLAVVALLAGGSGYAWWSGLIGNRPAQVALALQTELASAGLEGVRVTMGPGFVARIEGEVDSETMRNRALALAQMHPGISAVEDGLTLRDVRGEQLAAANAALAARGLTGLQVESGPGDGFTLVGPADGAAQVNDATAALAAAVPGVKISVNVTRSPVWLLADVRAALGRAGVEGARARMIDETTVMLEGEVASDDLRATAEAAARVPGIAGVENNLTVPEYAPLEPEIADAMGVEPMRPMRPMRTPVPRPPARQPPRAQVAVVDAVPAPFLGQWGGRVELFGRLFVVYLNMVPGRIGSVVGEGAYAAGNGRYGGAPAICRTALTLTQIDGDVITLEERLTTRSGASCPADKIIQLRAGSGSTAVSAQWVRKQDNSIAFRATLFPNLVSNGSRLAYLGTD
jgi:osmotically-inducible protein OsmY